VFFFFPFSALVNIFYEPSVAPVNHG